MPIYEFFCPKTNKIYSFYARSMALAGKTPKCPDNPKYRMERIISSFSVTGKKQGEESAASPEPDFPRMDKAMAEMERDFSGMDEENPDPRQLARMMRTMSSVSGEKMPETMEEMIKRMEAGEDPEKLEAEYGDALEDLEPGSPGAGAEPADPKKVPKRRGSRVVRDPTLYEMAEFV
jgi:hypothetical protein